MLSPTPHGPARPMLAKQIALHSGCARVCVVWRTLRYTHARVRVFRLRTPARARARTWAASKSHEPDAFGWAHSVGAQLLRVAAFLERTDAGYSAGADDADDDADDEGTTRRRHTIIVC